MIISFIIRDVETITAIFIFFFSFSLNSYNNEGKCILNETEKKLYSFQRKDCKIITFLDLEKIENEKSVFFFKKRRKVLLRVREKFPEEKLKWEERRKKI